MAILSKTMLGTNATIFNQEWKEEQPAEAAVVIQLDAVGTLCLTQESRDVLISAHEVPAFLKALKSVADGK